ncbi:T9SS type A sorting domain-containing protein [Balneolales bacterium ANBcel1]|nr:T9SS type A sorting domain-containing protein [Balneolales bacterium ANBcel1]
MKRPNFLCAAFLYLVLFVIASGAYAMSAGELPAEEASGSAFSTAGIPVGESLPLVYDEENTCVDCPMPAFPPRNDLPSVSSLPDPFAWFDGRGRIAHFSDWRYRRAEVGGMIHHYQVGERPPLPDDLQASYSPDDNVLTVEVTVGGNTLVLTSNIVLPEGDTDGPVPAVIGMGGPSGSLPSDIFTSRDIMQIPFNFGQVMSHTQTRGNEPINVLFPEHTHIGAYSAWPWGVSRLIDGLELIADEINLDMERLAVTGCSFAGKMALYAGAFDERIALTISQESGGGGYTAWRVNETLPGVERLNNTNASWFASRFQNNFSNAVNRLPFDHHELMAMVAPRALLVTGNPGYEWMADESGYVASRGAEEVYNALCIPERFGYAIVGGHSHCQVPENVRLEMEAFVDRFLLGDESSDTRIRSTVYETDLSPWITWETPELSDGSSFMETAPLQRPAEGEAGLDTEVIFEWEEVENAAVYRVQLAEDASFRNVLKEDSTSGTSVTFDGLGQGVFYHWRVRVRNQEGEVGPWGSSRMFSTDIPMPEAPQSGTALPHATRADFLRFAWNPAPYASSYDVQFATDPDFEQGVTSASTTDTSRVFYSTREGVAYYFRVRSNNLSGTSPWSETMSFTLVLGPSDLELHTSRTNEITLTWNDNSSIAEGFIIERASEAESVFSVIGTEPIESGYRYVDDGLESLTAYTYRVKAYAGSAESIYSNEATITAVSAGEEPGTPREFSLSQNYPNPFNPSTSISFGIPHESHVELNVYNLLGQRVESLVSDRMQPGFHTVVFDARALSSGVYFYTLRAGAFAETRTLSLIK